MPENKNTTSSHPTLSVITPAYNEADNLTLLFEELKKVLDGFGITWEWIIVDDHSPDDTFSVASGMAHSDARVRALRFSRNFGSHMALRCGMEHARGDCMVGMAADLQDPPAVIPELLAAWKKGAHVVWAARASRDGEKESKKFFARVYYTIMRDWVGMKDMPAEGADFFLLDRRVIDAVNRFSEKNVSLFALITWLGFKQKVIRYDKHAREHGKSGWTLEKKIKMAVDSLTSFSYKPIRVMITIGFTLSLLAFTYLLVVLINYLLGVAPEGWTSLMAAILLIGGLQIMMIGILGEYIWRSLDESRQRPRYVIEETTDSKKAN